MKRIFIVLNLLLALGVSTPFASAAGIDTFDINSNLQDNMVAWLTDSSDTFFPMFSLESEGYFDIMLIDLNPDLGLSLVPGVPSINGFATVQSALLPGDLADLLGQLIVEPVNIDSVQYFMLTGKKTLGYEWDENLIDVVPGSIFMGFSLGGAYEGMDIVLLLTPAAPSVVPVPAAVWLLGSGLAGLGLLRRKFA